MRWWARRSLRARLATVATAVFVLALAPLALLLSSRIQAALQDSLDASARQRAEEVTAALYAGPVPPALPHSSDADSVVVVVGPDGAPVASSADGEGLARLVGLPRGGGVRTLRDLRLGGESRTYRVVGTEVALFDGRYRVIAAVADDDVADGRRLLAESVLLGGATLVVLVAVGTWLLVGRALDPVERLRRQAESMSAADLGIGIEVPDSADELSRLAQTFADLLGRLDAAMQQQRRFVADAAHELRNPVAALLSQLEVRARERPSPDDEALAGQAQRLAGLVDDLLALTRLDAAPIGRERAVDLDDIVVAELGALRRRCDVRLDSTAVGAARVRGDSALLARVVRNLLDNAARHAATTVRVGLAVVGTEAVLRVTDDGAGVPAADRERVFDRFTRLDDARARDGGGVGLGLAIVREVVTAHGGRVDVEPSGPGGRFVVHLPRAYEGLAADAGHMTAGQPFG